MGDLRKVRTSDGEWRPKLTPELGRSFLDRPAPTGLRSSMMGAALKLQKDAG